MFADFPEYAVKEKADDNETQSEMYSLKTEKLTDPSTCLIVFNTWPVCTCRSSVTPIGRHAASA